jgi:AcrR family transcriptional regulator
MLPVMNATEIAKQTPAEVRAYNSPLRDRQAEQTRELILRALTEQLSDAGLKDFNIPRLARRAGVSVRTVYRYFPTKDALLEEFAYWLDSQIGSAEAPSTIEELVALPESAFPAFDEMEPLIRAQWLTPHGRASREVGRKRRLANWRKVLADVTNNLPDEEQVRGLGVVLFLLSSRAWQALKDEFGMDGRESGKAVSWALRTLIADLRKRNNAYANIHRTS